MKTQELLYGAIIAGAVLLTGCSPDDAALEPVPSSPVAISFDCAFASDGSVSGGFPAVAAPSPAVTAPSSSTRSPNGYTGTITAENNELRYTGFGVFASHAANTAPDLMYNQEVAFTFYANNVIDGYWTYSPLKYWPANPVGTCFYAYAPYATIPDDLTNEATGIVGISASNENTPYITYARAKHPEENIDLLWAVYEVTNESSILQTAEGDLRPKPNRAVPLTLHHALARIRINLTMTNDAPANAKVLVERIKLSGTIAKTGKLNLTGQTKNGNGKTVPTWFDQVTEPTIVSIYCDPENNTDSYGIVAENIRYIDELPYAWQPAGLAKDTKVNALCMGDFPSFLYLIPQEGGITIDCTVYYALVYNDGTATKHNLKKTDTAITVATTGDTNTALNGHLNGNTTYDLNMSFAIEE